MCLSVGLQQHGAMLPCFRLLVCLLMLLTSQAQSSKSSGTPSNEGLGEANKPAPSSTSPGVCEMYGLQPRQHQATQQVPRVIDCFLASNEVDMIEIRLRELEAVVDKFVVLESRMSFRGSKRTLHYPRVINRLPAAVVQKVKYVVLDTLVGNDAWAMEAMQRNALFDHAEAQPGDILILSDCDEIPKPTFVAAFKQCQGLKFPLSMQAAHHYYSFGVASTNVDQVWYQPRAVQYTASSSLKAQKLRTGKPPNTYPNSSWHCSSCLKYVSAIQTKIGSFSHSELDTPDHNNPAAIVSRVQSGKDLFDRKQMVFAKDTSGDMPAYIKAHPTRFSYLISRDVPDARFVDVDVPSSQL